MGNPSFATLIVFVFCILAIVAGCSEDHNRNPYQVGSPQIVNEELTRLYTLTNDLQVEVPISVTEQPGWPDALREIETGWNVFTWSYGARPPVSLIHFHSGVHPIESDGERAVYVGDGLIHACYHLRLPHTFCLPEAFADACRSAPTTGKTDGDIDRATRISQSWVGALYGLTDRID